MQHLLFSLILLFSLSSCNDSDTQSKHDTKRAQEIQIEKDALLSELKAKDIALKKSRKEAQEAKAKLVAQEQLRKEAFIEEQLKKEQEKKQIAQNRKLSPVGIEIQNNKITIDTNKTKDFFSNLTKSFENKIRNITKDIEHGVINQKDAGIKIDENHINIDLNKTKDFLEIWGKKMQGFVKEFDTMAKEINMSIK
jgi:hypothetical protein